MTNSEVIEGVYLSSKLDLEDLFADAFRPYADKVRIRSPQDVEDPDRIRFSVAWSPERDAFTPYPNLRLVSSIAAGVDSLINCPSLPASAHLTRIRDDVQADMMAGFAAWQVVWHHRNMGHYIQKQSVSTWDQQDLSLTPKDYTVGVLGYGLMGKAIAEAVAALGFPVVAAVRKHPCEAPAAGISFERGGSSVERVAAKSQALINVLPLTPQTENILNEDLFNQMPTGARLIQLGRGQHLVDEDLDRALASGQLGGASLDVFRTEPLPGDHRWWRNDKILITPHQASDSSAAIVAKQVTEAAIAAVNGHVPENTIDRTQGY
ncbi:NAD(P)-dependent oxidoreductase [Roseibium sp.]|uniref:NAD(P)-dependent oxidoreductase n=1 Tax=Roseibium sp. TaxID=1936156 RepID=UPI0032669C0E